MYKVLIVDDEPLIIHGLSNQVDWDSLNMELVGTAFNGQDALLMMALQTVHLLITDVSMPTMDGLTLIHKAKLINPSLRCIIISAYSEFDYVKKALQLGVENYLLKPINTSELNDTLAKTLENLVRDQLVVTKDFPDALAFRTNILDRWVNGTIQDFELYERAELLHIDLSAPYYMVCIIDVIHSGHDEHKFQIMPQLLDICKNLLFPSFSGECFIDGSYRVVVILYGESLEQLQSEPPLYLLRINEEAANSGIKIFSSVSPVSPASASVSASYAAALFHLFYRFVDPSAATILSSNSTDQQIRLPDEAQHMLVQFVKNLKAGNLQHILDHVEKYMQLYSDIPFPDAITCSLPLVLTLVQTMIESGRLSDELPARIKTQLANYTKINSNDSFKNWLFKTIADSLQVIHERKRTFHLLIHHTLEQLNNHYATELSLKTLASGFNVSPAYLGQLFKEETGKYFNDYLTQVRLQASRTFLLETDLKIGELIHRIGIANQSYFNRVFKKTYGLSPVEFRRHGLKQ